MARLLRGLWNRATSPAGLALIGTTGATLVGSFQFDADAKDFFEYKFKTTKDADAIVDFYSTEDFLQVLGIFPQAIHFILAGVNWDTQRENTMAVWSAMQISFDITQKEEKIGDKDMVTLYNKRERFINYIPFTKILLWDQVQNYGYRRLPDGTLEVSHQGESFHGPWPVKYACMLHAMYVVWATEKHINSPLFGTEDLEAQEHQRSNIPLHVAKEWLADLQQQQAGAKGKLVGTSEDHAAAEATNVALRKLQRKNTTISVERRADGKLKLHVEDPEARETVKAALQNIKSAEGVDAAGAQLQKLLTNHEVNALPSSKKKAAAL